MLPHRRASAHNESPLTVRDRITAGRGTVSIGARRAMENRPVDRNTYEVMTDYLVVYEQTQDGASGAHSPDTDDMYSLGRTPPDAAVRLRRPAPGDRVHALRNRRNG